MRIDALKYRTEDNQDIIIVVDLQVGYAHTSHTKNRHIIGSYATLGI